MRRLGHRSGHMVAARDGAADQAAGQPHSVLAAGVALRLRRVMVRSGGFGGGPPQDVVVVAEDGGVWMVPPMAWT